MILKASHDTDLPREVLDRYCAEAVGCFALSRELVADAAVVEESVVLTATIEAEEHRDVATFDIPNALIQTQVDEKDEHGDRIAAKIRGAVVDMLVETDPD